MSLKEAAPAWHALHVDEVYSTLAVDGDVGLRADEAHRRLARDGFNRLSEKPPRALWLKFVDQFRSLLVAILIVAAVLAFLVGNPKDVIAILVVVVLNAAFGFYQESRAQRSLAALRRMLALKARVRRDGRNSEIDADTLVTGDIVLLEAGDKVPADGRLVEAHNVEIDESALSGESLAVAKHVAAVADAAAPAAERTNMAFMNTVVTRGRARMSVTATGMRTEMGRIADMMQAAPEAATPLQTQLDRLGKRLAVMAGGTVALIFGLALYQGEALANAALTAVTLAVAAIPEGLPAVVTVTLALGMRRMAASRAIVKRLAAVETLGCTSVICSDKTGTLTLNQMTAQAFVYHGRHFAVSGQGYAVEGDVLPTDGGTLPDLAPLLLPAALCNDSRIRDGVLTGDPTEGALAALAAKGGIDAPAAADLYPRIAEITFDSANKFMATFHHDGDRVRMFVKGAPDVLLARCRSVAAAAHEDGLDSAARASLERDIETLGSRGLRVLAIATRTLSAREFDPAGDLMHHVSELTMQGLVGILDPARPEAREAIALCRKAGIQVKMITGDHKATAVAIADSLGLAGEVVTGRDLDRMDDAELARRVEQIAVFARVAPEHKVRIVQALKSAGHVVAMTGDGVNDAPALRSADIGVAMGVTGTEVSKEAATMVLTDDNFATIVHAVREGRTIYDNIVKFVRFQLGTNIGALGTMLGASLLGWPVPFNPIQILWVNMIMDGPPALALGVDPARPGIMREPPRSTGAEILDWRRLRKVAAFGVTMTIGTLTAFSYGLHTGDAARALTLAFTTFVLFQFFNLFNARAEYGSIFSRHFFVNRPLWLALGCIAILQVVAVHWGPAQRIFHTTDLALTDWALATALASSVVVLEELRKCAERLISGRREGAAHHVG